MHSYDAHQRWIWYWKDLKTEFIIVDTHINVCDLCRFVNIVKLSLTFCLRTESSKRAWEGKWILMPPWILDYMEGNKQFNVPVALSQSYCTGGVKKAEATLDVVVEKKVFAQKFMMCWL